MRKPILILALALLIVAPAFAQWQGETRISNSSSTSYTPYTGGWGTAADGDNVYITWYDYTESPYYVRHHSFPIHSPSQAPGGLGDQISDYYGYTPVVATYDGEVDVSWYYSYVLYTRIRNGGWGSIYSHGVGGGCTQADYPGTCFDADGNLLVAHNRYSSTSGDMRGRSVWFHRKLAGTTTFTTPVLVYDPHWEGGSASSYYYSYYPSICVTSDGIYHMSFGNSNGYRLYHAWSDDDGASWNIETLTGTNSCYYSYNTKICRDSEDNVYIAYVSYPSPYHIFVITGTWNGEGYSWSSPVQVSHSTYSYVYYPSICCDIFDNIWVCWDDYRGADYELWYNRLDGESGTWDGDAPITSDDDMFSRRGQLAADLRGNVHVAWYDYRDYSSGGSYEIYYNYFDADTGGGTGPSHDTLDLIMESVIRPHGVEDGGVAFTPSCLIWQNLEDTTIDAEVLCRIKNYTTQQTVYEDVIGAYPLDPGYNQVSAFKSFTPEGNTEYDAFFVVNHPDDINTNNNDKNQRFNTKPRIDVTPYAAIMPEPETEVNAVFAPSAWFQERGGMETEDVIMHCMIEDVAYAAVVYEDALAPQTFAEGDSAQAVFASVPGDFADGHYMITYWATQLGVDISHPALFYEFDYKFTGITEGAFGFALHPITPNPFSGSTKVSFSLTGSSPVSLKVYDVSGKVVTTLASGNYGAGSHTINWDTDVAPGVYFVRFVTPKFKTVQKVMVIN
ncbi:T9SS type A sorting domain-containing protein [candidate division WOR-3 bacterium]|nr:T9SS type A sorting domain-containing protein [candidate division WOR-3 bacterium]